LFEDLLDEVAAAMDDARSAERAKRADANSADTALSAVANLLPTSAEVPYGEEALSSVSAGQDPFSQTYPRRDSNPRYRLESATEGPSDNVENR